MRVPPWGSFAISVALLAIAELLIVGGSDQALAGAIVGYVAAYWLPGRRESAS